MRIPDGYGTVFPYLMVRDAPGYLRFLGEAFGAVEVHRTLGEHGRIANAQVRLGTTMFMVSEAATAFPPTAATYYLFVEDADAIVARACALGCEQVLPVEDRPYGDRQGGVRDRAGNIWWVSQRLVDGPYT